MGQLLRISSVILGYLLAIAIIYYTIITTNTYKIPHHNLPFGTAEVLSYTQKVPVGGIIHTLRRIVGEPKGCTVRIRRYLSPIDNTRLELLIFDIIRITEGKGDEQIDFVTPLPDTIPTGHYLFYARVEYYCSWAQYIFGPAMLVNQPVLLEVTPKEK